MSQSWRSFLHAAMSEMFQASRVPLGRVFPVSIRNPQPYGVRLAKLSSTTARGISPSYWLFNSLLDCAAGPLKNASHNRDDHYFRRKGERYGDC